MTTLALSSLLDGTPRLLSRLNRAWNEFLAGMAEARAMSDLYRDLAALPDRELAARGLARQDIPRAVLAAVRGR
jgi:hypothetical protein